MIPGPLAGNGCWNLANLGTCGLWAGHLASAIFRVFELILCELKICYDVNFHKSCFTFANVTQRDNKSCMELLMVLGAVKLFKVIIELNSSQPQLT